MFSNALAALLVAATPYRLPASGDFTKPSHYDLHFTVDPVAGSFSGEEAIRVDVAGHPASVILHAVDLTLSEARLEQGGKSQPVQVKPHADTETVELVSAAPLAPGPAIVHVKFAAKLRDDLRGIYLVKTATGDAYAVSQFEATDARRAFPCYDEPTFKATYAITATIPQGMVAISNGPETADPNAKVPQGMKGVVFAETPPISSYLVALAVGKFASVEGEAKDSQKHTHIRVWAPQGSENLGLSALATAMKVLPWYEGYFGLPYPYAKLDMVAVPDFDAGGMENAGAIFYRDTALLLDDKNASVQAQKRVGIVVDHEIAHQWFGDLVTMDWWDDLWLNEAFAELMEDESTAALHPEWDVWSQFQMDAMDVMVTDSLSASHPIHVPVATAEEANALFDDITYSKGSAVLRMLELFLTPKVWQAGVHNYLAAHALGNASEADLWEALSAASGKDVGKVAASWFEQAGYPLVDSNHTSGHPTSRKVATRIVLSQERFTVKGKAAGDEARWQVPVCLDYPQGKLLAQVCTLLTDATGTVELPGAPAWFDANAHAAGFYRVDYGQAGWSALTGIFDKQRGQGIDGPERMALISDAFWLAKSDRSSLERVLNIFAKLPKERNYSVWRTALDDLATLEKHLVEGRDRDAFHGFLSQILRPTAAEVGWRGPAAESPTRRLLRAAVLEGLTDLAEDPQAIDEAKAQLAAFDKDSSKLDLTLLPLVLKSAARHGDAALWEELRGKMETAATPELRDRYRSALAEFRDPALIQKTLDLTLSGGIRKQDVPYELGALIGNRYASEQARTFLLAHWGELKERFSGIAATWSVLPALGDFCSAETREQLNAFFSDPKNHVEGGDRAMQLALERIDACVRFKASHAAELSQWLEKRVPRHASR